MDIHKRVRLMLCSLLFVALALLPAAQTFAGQGFYTVDKSTRTGMLVSLTKNPGVVAPASTKTAASLVGVIGNSSNDLTIQPDQVAVQTDGVVTALLSTQNGDIAVGDRVGPSSIEGLGAKVSAGGWSVGVAQGSLDAHTAGVVRSVVSDTAGGTHTIYTAALPIIVKIAYASSAADSNQQKSTIPKVIQDIADSVAGHHASAAAVILSFLLLLTGIGIGGFIANVAIRNGLRGIARQPLTKQTIVRQMTRSVWGAVGLVVLSISGALVIIHVL